MGQMAASISHNLKNPLGSIKTILQVQMENPELPASDARRNEDGAGGDSAALGKLNQLLQFSRPASARRRRGGKVRRGEVAEEVAGVLSHEAENRGIALEVEAGRAALEVAASAEALNEILSNLVVNALEATSRGGHVHGIAGSQDGDCSVSVEDDGAGHSGSAARENSSAIFHHEDAGNGARFGDCGAACGGSLAERLNGNSPMRDGAWNAIPCDAAAGEQK